MNLRVPQAVFLVGLGLYLAVRVVYQKRASGSSKAVNRSNGRDRLLVLFVIMGQIILPLFYILSPWFNFANYESLPALMLIGTIMWIVGLWMFWRSHADLGTNWSVNLELRSAHQLVTNGVYRFVRHPMYAAFLLLGVAQSLLLPNWLAGLAALAAVVLLCIMRIPNEEAMMQEHFGKQYREYMQRTGRVIPRWVVPREA